MRLLILQRLIAGALALLWVGLFATQVVQGPRYREQAEKNRTRLIHLPAPRGSILDRHGVPLAEDRLGFELAIFPRELKEPGEVWGRLSPIVGIPAQALAEQYQRKYEAPFSFVSLARSLPPETAFLLEEKRLDLPGTLIRPMPQRHYPLGPAVGAVAGYVGLIAPEELTKLKPYGYTFRDLIGKDGLEEMLDRHLRGRDGGLQVEVDARGRFIRQLGFRHTQRGRSVRVSLDGRLQGFCYRLLSDCSGAILVMDAKSGEMLALVSRPSFDPNAFLDPARRLEVRQALHRRDQPMFNRAIGSLVPPGSTFKVAVAYQALKSKRIAPNTPFVCSGSFQLGTALFRCWKEEGHGSENVVGALEHSCNVFFYQTGRRLKADGIGQAARIFGLGHPTGIDLPREAKGFVPDAHWMERVHAQKWQEGDTLSFAIGQGPLLVSPIQMLLLTTAIAMDGSVPKPHLLLGIEGEDPLKPPHGTKIPLDPKALQHVKHGMEQVVNSPTGTGRLAQVPGLRAAGKTGTAQVSQGLSHAWFCGYAPAEDPALGFVIFLEHGGKGGEQAALLARDLLAYLKELGTL
jgi:penicillin-binding protein 2